MSYSPGDEFDFGVSNCCGAGVYLGGICANCKDHCDIQEDEEEEEFSEFTVADV